MTKSRNRQQRTLHFDPMTKIGAVADRPLTQLRGRQRLQSAHRRISAYLNVLLTEPAKLGIYPTLSGCCRSSPWSAWCHPGS